MSRRRTLRTSGSLVFSIGCALGLAHAETITLAEGAITVTNTVTFMGGLYQYDYTVADATGQLAVLDIGVTPGVAISGLAAPGGSSAFTSAIDTTGSGSGEQEFVSFLENNGMFSGTESGFIFNSPVAPGATIFNVTLFDGATGTGNGITGPVGPQPSVVPEPSSLLLCALGGAAFLFRRKRFPLLAPDKSRN